MTQLEFKSSLKKIEDEKEQKIKELRVEYALSNNKVKVGDIFKDHLGCIKVESIKVTMSSFDGIPSCVYVGVQLKKDLTPFKNGEKRHAWQSNAI